MTKYEASLEAAGFKSEKISSGSTSVEVMTRPVSPEVATSVRKMESLPAPPPAPSADKSKG
jgi:hypothetical protein